MSKQQHTPGPWRLGELVNHGHATYGHPIYFNDDGEHVVDFVYTTPDAHLIAAAPELLEALEAYLIEDEIAQGFGSGVGGEIQEKARAAIAKARGES